MSTLKEVADKAHVSSITVSRVINTPELVKPATRERVEKVMASLQYVPNIAAKNLVTRRTGIIDVYIPEDIDLSNPFVVYFIAGISDTLSKRMYSFLLLRNRKKENFCDGYIVTGLLRNEIQEFNEYAKERSRPIVLFGHTELPDVDCIDVDNVTGAKRATEQLIAKGHQRIAMINVDENKDYTTDRRLGYQAAMVENKLPVSEKDVFYAANNLDGGCAATRDILQKNGYTAIFCATDTLAIGAVKAIAEMGLNVPGDISLVGFDGLGHQLLTTPHLSTVYQPIYEIGKELAQTLIDKLDGKKAKTCRMLEPTFIPGASIAEKKV